MPIMPWESEHAIPNKMFDTRYLHYDDWGEQYKVKWEDSHQWDYIKFVCTDDDILEKAPACEEEDEEALRALLATLRC
jgi:hypothetical protein